MSSSRRQDLFLAPGGSPRVVRGVAIDRGAPRMAELAMRLGFETMRVEMKHGPTDFAEANARTHLFVQIETIEAAADLDAICSVQGDTMGATRNDQTAIQHQTPQASGFAGGWLEFPTSIPIEVSYSLPAPPTTDH